MKKLPARLSDIPKGHVITASGNLINLFNPDPLLLDIEDIAASLSKQCRWNGNIPHFYSVAQHCCHVVHLAPLHLKYAALMHDAPETYAGDVIRPIKHLLAISYFEIEERLKQAVCTRFKLHPDLLDGVTKYDDEALDLEYEALYFHDSNKAKLIGAQTAVYLDHMPAQPFWDHQTAFVSFLQTFWHLSGMNGANHKRLPKTG